MSTATMSLEQIGQKLKSARESQGLSLGQIHERTKIPLASLEAIEGGRVDELPEPVYVGGFLKRYGDLLGLSGQALADEFKKAGQDQGNGRFGIFGAGRGRETPPAPVTYMKNTVNSEAPSFTRTFFYPSLLLIAVLAAVCGLAAWQQAQMSQQDPGLYGLRDSATRYNASGTQVPTQNQGGLPQPQVQQGAPQATDARVILSASQHVWVEIKAVSTGTTLYTGFLETGDNKEFTDPQGVTVHAGNGGSLSVDFQGKKEVFGPSGKPKEFSYMAVVPKTVEPVDTAATTTAAVKPVTNVKRTPVKRATGESGSSPARRPRAYDGPTRDIPSAGGARSIDVPYRYNEGRLDND